MSLLFLPKVVKDYRGGTGLIQLVVSVILYFVIFFGIAFILNMLLRKTWLMSFLYPIVMIIIIDDISTVQYFTSPIQSISIAFTKLINIKSVDMIILGSGFVGTIVSGFVIKWLRKSGYQMF